jgi:aldose 1-epimerase
VVIAEARRPLTRAARLEAPRSGASMEVWTTEPGLQFYAGHMIECASEGLESRRYGPFSGVCLEPQIWPDAPNRPEFPSATLRPGETLRQTTEYRFVL